MPLSLLDCLVFSRRQTVLTVRPLVVLFKRVGDKLINHQSGALFFSEKDRL